MSANLTGAKLRFAVVKEWNKGELNMAQVGEMFGKPRTTISRILNTARKYGMVVLSVDSHDAATRNRKSFACHSDPDRIGKHMAMMRSAKRGRYMERVGA